MGLLSKIKGIFIEDVPDDEEEDKKEEKEITVAKKIENKDRKEEKEEVVERRVDREPKEVLELETPKYDEKKEEKLDQTKEYEKSPAGEFKFGFSDDDFKVEEAATTPKEEPKKEEEAPKKNVVLYHQSTVTTVKDNYKETSYHEVYEANGNREEKHTFQRSPIISPVWGILDKNYKKEEIVAKKDIRLTTNNKKADLDAVREKAYGDLANDISSSIEESKEDTSVEDNLLYDLSDNEGPSVKKVTVGDAEEYYSDLGLEYNVDYKMEKEEPKDEDDGKELELVQNSLENNETNSHNNDSDDEENEEDNLFDLIDSMYDDKE